MFPSLTQYSERQTKAALRVLDTLDRIDERTGRVYEKQRKHRRNNFRGQVGLYLDDAQTLEEIDEGNVLIVWARAISQSGLSFIAPDRVTEQRCLLGISMPDGARTWFRSVVVRARDTNDEGFWEHGVAFEGRMLTAEEATAKAAEEEQQAKEEKSKRAAEQAASEQAAKEAEEDSSNKPTESGNDEPALESDSSETSEPETANV